MSAGMEALGSALAGQAKLFHVRCVRKSEKKQDEYVDGRCASVVGTSLENAALKAVQFFNESERASDYEAESVSVEAETGASGGRVFIP
jgi:hypothetical protein